MRVCQFRHDGKWTSIVAAARTGRRIRKACSPILQALGSLSNQPPKASREQGLSNYGPARTIALESRWLWRS